MKYIRTKDGVYELKVNKELKAEGVSNYFYVKNKKYGCNLLYDKQDLKKFKQADTIEELCDELVYCHDIITKEHAEEILQSKEYICKEIYGAIWTDKGLIYVAKMNEKGELELL